MTSLMMRLLHLLSLTLVGRAGFGFHTYVSPELCCGDVSLSDGDDEASTQWRCCGGSIRYSPSSQMCCFGEASSTRGRGPPYVLDIPLPISNGSIVSQPGSDVEDGAVRRRFLSCCGDHVFDFRFSTCCKGHVHALVGDGSNRGCCGTRAYDPYTQLCCGKRIVPRGGTATASLDGSSSACCGRQAYDQSTQLCCGGTVFDVSAPSGGNSGIACCGNATYDTDEELCCDKQFRLKKASTSSLCCPSAIRGRYEAFDWERELCCEGRVFPRTSPTHFCCGAETYDTETHVCCMATVIPKRKRKLAQEGFLKRSGLLSHGRHRAAAPPLFFIEDEEQVCCGSLLYDYDTELCCAGKVIPKKSGGSGHWKCCGQEAYDERSALCCQGNVVALSTGDGAESGVQKRSMEDCCGMLAFNVHMEICCQGVIHQVPQGPSLRDGEEEAGATPLIYCCGNSTYDVFTETCCNGKKTPKKSRLL